MRLSQGHWQGFGTLLRADHLYLIGYVAVTLHAEAAIAASNSHHVAGVEGVPVGLEDLRVLANSLLVPAAEAVALLTRGNLLKGSFHARERLLGSREIEFSI